MSGLISSYFGILRRQDTYFQINIVAHCRTEMQAQQVLSHIKRRLAQCRLEVHPEKTRIVYCKDDDRAPAKPKMG